MKFLLVSYSILTSGAFAQGPLAPPSAPAPSMKSLAQIEARTAISATTNISTPGSYYLTGDLAGEISIYASDVTLDLNGFTIRNLYRAISVGNGESFKNITIRNGSVVAPGVVTFTGAVAGGFSGAPGSLGIVVYGRTAGTVSAQNIHLENLNVRGFQRGIQLSFAEEVDGGRHIISGCTVRDFGTYGIIASQLILRDTVIQNGVGFAIYGNAIIAENLLVDRIIGIGISGDNQNLAHLNVRSCSGDGINSSYSRINGGQISSCATGIVGSDNQIDSLSINACTSTGIFSPNSSITNVTASQNAGAGIWADSSTISNSIVRQSGADGIRGVNSVISLCKSSGNDTNTGDGYSAAGIVWNGGRQVDNVCDSYAPAAPAP